MKEQRQKKILEIIEVMEVETQEQLLEELKKHGFSGTQATISRDIKELRLVKELTPFGGYRYTAAAKDAAQSFTGKLTAIFRESVISMDWAGNMVAIKTYPGLASAACSALDSMSLSFMVGTLAGDDTAFILMRSEEDAKSFCLDVEKFF